MANPAFPRPDMPGPQPVAATKVTSDAVQRTPLLRSFGRRRRRSCLQIGDDCLRSGGLGRAFPDRLRTDVRFAPYLARVWLQVLRRAAIGIRSASSLALCLSSTARWFHRFVALGHRGTALRRRGCVHHRDVSEGSARSAFVLCGIAGRDSQRHLRIVGNIRARAPLERVCSALSCENAGMDRALRRSSLRYRHAGGGNHSGDHDHSDHFLDHPRSAHGRAPASARGSPGLGSHALGNDSSRACCATRAPELSVESFLVWAERSEKPWPSPW